MHQPEDSIVDLLQTLADMDITFKALKVNYPSILCFKIFFSFLFFLPKFVFRSSFVLGILQETDIGRHVNQLRKHPSNDVRRLVKHLVRFVELFLNRFGKRVWTCLFGY